MMSYVTKCKMEFVDFDI